LFVIYIIKFDDDSSSRVGGKSVHKAENNQNAHTERRTKMKRMKIIAGFVSLLIAAVLALTSFTRIDLRLSESIPTNINIYPAAFFALLGVMLIFLGLKPLLRS
jgi:hypothetical protein